MPNLQKNIAALILVVAAIASNIGTCCAQVTHSFTEPIEKRELAASQPDVVGNVMIKEGSVVKANEILAELDNRVLNQSLKIAQLRAASSSQIESAQANFMITKQKFEKLRPMLDRGHANPAEVEKARAEFEKAKAELSMAQEKKQEYQLEVERIRSEIETRMIRSPFDGVVTEIHFHPGEFIASDARQLVTVVRLQELRVRFYLFAETAAKLRKGQPVGLKIGEDQKSTTGKVEFVSPITDPDSGTTRVDVVIDNQNNQYRSGSLCVWKGPRSMEVTSNSRTNARKP